MDAEKAHRAMTANVGGVVSWGVDTDNLSKYNKT